MSPYRAPLCWLLLSGLFIQTAAAQAEAARLPASPPKHEFRGAWIATVVNLDWPSAPGLSSTVQQGQLLDLLDGLQDAGINAVFFQVRAEADAFYASEIEPWSFWLTGEQGRAPEPFYDPLAFAVEEAHRRGMALHAWINPYRASRGSGYAAAPSHVSLRHPEWILRFGALQLLDPGLPEVRDYITRVIVDVARRYDVDGIHFDDFFYPYPPNQITNEDAATFAAHHGGFGDVAAWRRDNVNRFVAQVHDSLQAVNPALTFGISPFGIWKTGVPPGIVGLDAYSVIYADATAWLGDETVDYVVPQLYWPFGGGQDYGLLAPWWASVRNERHVYAGHGLFRADPATATGTPFAADEVPRQVRFNRAHPGILGSAFFRAENITSLPSMGFADSLKADLYRHPALTPPMAWKDGTPPGAPRALAFTWTGAEEVTLTWEPPAATEAAPPARLFAVYRVRSEAPPDFAAAVEDAHNLLAVTGETRLADRPGLADEVYHYAVTAVSANSIESPPGNVVTLEGRAVAVDDAPPAAFALYQNYPNPFSSSTSIPFSLDRPARVTLRVYDVLGREAATLVHEALYGAGAHAVRWDGTGRHGLRLAGGAYLYVLEAGTRRLVKGMVLHR